MLKISQVVLETLGEDDVALAAAQGGLLNLSAYARQIQPQVSARLRKSVQVGSIITALSRLTAEMSASTPTESDLIQRLSVHSNLEGMTFERTESVSRKIREIYSEIEVDNKTYLTVTQGINEVTVVAESQVAQAYRAKLRGAHKIYDKKNLVGITVKFHERYLQIPNLIYALCWRLAHRSVNIVEIVSTATELTYVIDRDELSTALEQLQKELSR